MVFYISVNRFPEGCILVGACIKAPEIKWCCQPSPALTYFFFSLKQIHQLTRKTALLFPLRLPVDMILIRFDIKKLTAFLFFRCLLHFRYVFLNGMYLIHHCGLCNGLPVGTDGIRCMLVGIGFCLIKHFCLCPGSKPFPVRKTDHLIQKAVGLPIPALIQGMAECDIPHG